MLLKITIESGPHLIFIKIIDVCTRGDPIKTYFLKDKNLLYTSTTIAIQVYFSI